jgi:hypothetical protein
MSGCGGLSARVGHNMTKDEKMEQLVKVMKKIFKESGYDSMTTKAKIGGSPFLDELHRRFEQLADVDQPHASSQSSHDRVSGLLTRRLAKSCMNHEIFTKATPVPPATESHLELMGRYLIFLEDFIANRDAAMASLGPDPDADLPEQPVNVDAAAVGRESADTDEANVVDEVVRVVLHMENALADDD